MPSSIGRAGTEVFSPNKSVQVPFTATLKGWKITNPSGGAVAIGMSGSPSITSSTANTNIGASVATGEPCLIQVHTSALAALTDFGFCDVDISGGVAGNGTPLKQIKQALLRARIDSIVGNGRTWIGTGALQNFSTTNYSHDLLAFSFIGFRFSVGSDLTIKAYCGNTITQQVSDTGIAADSVHTHQFAWTFDGAKVAFFIDGTQVALVTNSGVFPNELLGNVIVIDNQNFAAATHVSASYAYMVVN